MDRQETAAYKHWQVMCEDEEFAFWHCTYKPATHNEAGGYIEACGDLPGLIGDDC